MKRKVWIIWFSLYSCLKHFNVKQTEISIKIIYSIETKVYQIKTCVNIIQVKTQTFTITLKFLFHAMCLLIGFCWFFLAGGGGETKLFCFSMHRNIISPWLWYPSYSGDLLHIQVIYVHVSMDTQEGKNTLIRSPK